jgi:hypothetical protein
MGSRMTEVDDTIPGSMTTREDPDSTSETVDATRPPP